jgi:translation initiation factor 2 subunit 2
MTTCDNISFIIEEKKLMPEEQVIISKTDAILVDSFIDSKKKKKKNKDKEHQEIDENQITNEEQEIADMFDLKQKKRKKDKKDKSKDETVNENKYSEDYDPPNYTYEILLNQLYLNFQHNNINVVKTKNSLKLPIVNRLGSKKTGWLNFKDCCASIGREQTSIINYLTGELSTEANMDGNGILVIRGIYNQKNIENLLRKFIINYVQCSVCKSLETNTRKDSNSRINFLECLACKSTRALQQIIANKAGSKNTKIND